MQVLLEMAASVKPTKQLESARVYSHHSVPASFNLILFWDTASVPMKGSETALLILEGLKKLGLLDHTVFMEKGTSEKLKRIRKPKK